MSNLIASQDLVISSAVSQLSTPPGSIEETINWLVSIGLPPLPECPVDADKYGKEPKAPHYMTRSGEPYSVSWKPWQKKLPPQELINKWFLIPRGIGTLAVFNGKHWITFADFDRKNFNGNCDEVLNAWEKEFPIMQSAPMFRTPSGGYRYIVALEKEPDNFKSNSGFVLASNLEQHCGEILCKNGGHTLLPPTIGVNGTYVWERWCEYPPVIEKLEDIGIQPKLLKKIEKPKPINNSSASKNLSNNTELSDVISQINSKLDFETAFNWSGHNFRYDNSDKVKGCCPWHESQSGTAFYVERTGNAYLWRCPACNMGGDLIGYRSLLAGGNIHPRGKEFINIIKELCEETGVIFPEKSKPKPSQKDKKQVSAQQDLSDGQDYDVYRMTTTSDDTIFKSLFQNGDGDWAVINDAFYQYSGNGYWKHESDSYVNHLIAHALRKVYQVKKVGDEKIKEFKFANERNKSGAFKYCKSALAKKNTLYNNHLSAFLNCTVDLRTGEQLKHDRNHFVIHPTPANYVPNAECPEIFKQFINNAFGEEFIDLIRAVTAMILDPTAPYGYFPCLIGPSGSGKGTLLRLWGSMVGEGGVRSITSFGDITSPEGRHQNMTGVRLIKFPDMGGFQGNLRAFYELVDNGAMSGRVLFSSSGYEREWNCRFVIACVHYLSIENSGDGWDRRCIPMPTKQRQGEIDPDLGRKLQLEKGAIISWALGMDRKERDRLIMNSVFANEKIANLKREQSIHSDSVRAFVDACLRPSDSPAGVMENYKLHDLYMAFCKANGYQGQSTSKFISHLRGVLLQNNVPRKVVRSGGKLHSIPAHFSYIEVLPRAFNALSSSEGDLPQWQCYRAFCLEGGLDAFEDFWQEKLLQGQELLQGSYRVENADPVTAESIVKHTTQDLLQELQGKNEKFSLTEPKSENSNNGLLEFDNKTNHDENKNSIDIYGNFLTPGCNSCNSGGNLDTESVTGTLQGECVEAVTVALPCNTATIDPVPSCAKTEDPRVLVSEVIVKHLESESPSWEVVKDILSQMEISSYSLLHGFITLGEFTKLEMLIPASERVVGF